MEQFRAFLRRKNIVFSAKRYGVDALGAMAQGLFCTLLVGTILNTLGTQFHIGFLSATVVTVGTGEAATAYTIGGLASAMVGPAMAVAIGSALQAPALVLFSLVPVGYATNILGGAGGPLAVLVIAIVAAECGKAVSKETKVDILVTPIVTVLVGIGVAYLVAPPIGTAASWVGNLIMWATELQPFFMGILVSVIVGIALTLPISSAAICAALGLTGLAGGAAVAGCCAQMVGLCGVVLPGEPVGRAGVPGTGHLHAPNGQHCAQSPDLDSPHLGLGPHRPHCHLPVPAGDERHPGLLGHGDLRPGGAHRGLHRLGGGHRRRAAYLHWGNGLAGLGPDLLRAPRGSDLAAWDSLPEGGLDQGRGLETGGLSDRAAWWKSQKPFLVEKFHKKRL